MIGTVVFFITLLITAAFFYWWFDKIDDGLISKGFWLYSFLIFLVGIVVLLVIFILLPIILPITSGLFFGFWGMLLYHSYRIRKENL